MARLKYLPAKYGKELNMERFSYTSATAGVPDIRADKKEIYGKSYGKNVLLVKYGYYIYDVTSEPNIYYELAR